jgi:2-hydroxy-3-keto-5-methylthiopentenyl-1-phosphate phosphatase
MMAPFKLKKAASAGLYVHRGGKNEAVLVDEKVPKGSFSRPLQFDAGPEEDPKEKVIRALDGLGLGSKESSLKTVGVKMVYYAKEVRHDEHLFAFKAPLGYKAPRGYKWLTPTKAFGSFLLSGHKRGIIKLFPKILPLGMKALDHIPVAHPSGIVVLCDFDGTVSEVEASLAILRHFIPGQWEKYERPWLEKEISTHDCLGYQFTMLKVPVEEMARFASHNIGLRKGFKEFVAWCRAQGHGLVITSSGVDFYIKAILDHNGIGDVPFIADRTHWVEGIGHIAEEGLFNEDCDWCGNCKLDLLKLYRNRKAKVIYVGDGATDECPAAKADMVLARARLLEFCKKEKLGNCFPYETFFDVRKAIEKWSEK